MTDRRWWHNLRWWIVGVFALLAMGIGCRYEHTVVGNLHLAASYFGGFFVACALYLPPIYPKDDDNGTD